MERGKTDHGITDYSISQTTLDDVFISFAKQQGENGTVVKPGETSFQVNLIIKLVIKLYLYTHDTQIINDSKLDQTQLAKTSFKTQNQTVFLLHLQPHFTTFKHLIDSSPRYCHFFHSRNFASKRTISLNLERFAFNALDQKYSMQYRIRSERYANDDFSGCFV